MSRSSRADMFLPTRAVTRTPAGTIVPLTAPRFVIRAKYFDPLRQMDAPLPPHVFVLFCVEPKGLKPILGGVSDARGVSSVPYEDDHRFGAGNPSASWGLGWLPVMLRSSGSRQLDEFAVERGEVFVDLERQEWVSSSEVGFLDRRKLLRLPIWKSTHKAPMGGFKQGVPNTRFHETGLFSALEEDAACAGTPNEPWEIQIDHGLFRNYVRLQFYDLKSKQREPVPPGLVVHVLGKHTLSRAPALEAGTRVAAGTAIDETGLAYLLHERTADASSDAQYYFATRPRRRLTDKGCVIVDLNAPPADRLRALDGEPEFAPRKRYLLPPEWHSHGTSAFEDEGSDKPPKRQPFEVLRLAGTERGRPLSFHLDDLVLVNGNGEPVKIQAGSRVALFDHVMHLRDHDESRPHFWRQALDRNYLVAEEGVHVEKEGIESCTRLVYLNGLFYDVQERRVLTEGGHRLGETPGIGLRAAVLNDTSGRAILNCMDGIPGHIEPACAEFHLIDVSYVRQAFPTVAGTSRSMKLVNLLVHVPFKIDDSRVGPQELKPIFRELERAAHRWDQTHAGHPKTPASDAAPRTFGLIPLNAAGPGADKLVKVRHYFTEAPARKDAVTIRVLPKAPGARASADVPSRVLTLFAGDSLEGNGGWPDEPKQAANTTRSTLAHEIGHFLGWPDEYDECVVTDGFPTFARSSATESGQYAVGGVAARPFSTDEPSLMRGNNQPRVRHYWAYAHLLRQDSRFRGMLDDKDYVAVDPVTIPGSLLSSELPYVGPEVLPNEHGKVWYLPVVKPCPVHDETKRSELVLYRLPEDEGTVRRMFVGPGGLDTVLPPEQRYQGLALVVIRILFEFHAELDNPKDRTLAYRLLSQYGSVVEPEVGERYCAYMTPYVLLPDPDLPKGARTPPYLRRIAVGVSLQFESASRRRRKGLPPVQDQHLTIHLVPERNGPNPLLSGTAGDSLTLQPNDLGVAVLCHALGVDPADEDGNLKTAFWKGDFRHVARTVSQVLKDPAGTRRSVRWGL